MTKALLFSPFLFGYMAVSAQNTVWNVDKSHSTISFAIDHLVISETVGQFEDYTLQVKADKPDFTDATFKSVIQVKSINTKDAKRDEHLKDPSFFDVEKYPVITFQGKQFRKTKSTGYEVVGDLTIHGVTKPVTLQAKFGGIVKDPWGGTRAGLKAWGEIDRFDFGLKYNAMLESGGLAVGQKVRLTIHIELIKEVANP